MKLPEYDNRPQPGESLYSSPDDGAENIKMGLLALFGILALIGFFVFGIGGMLTLLLNFLHAIIN